MQDHVTLITFDRENDTATFTVYPAFWQLDADDQRKVWDRNIGAANKAGFYLMEDLFPACDPRHCMTIDPDGTEHHKMLLQEVPRGVDFD